MGREVDPIGAGVGQLSGGRGLGVTDLWVERNAGRAGDAAELVPECVLLPRTADHVADHDVG